MKILLQQLSKENKDIYPENQHRGDKLREYLHLGIDAFLGLKNSTLVKEPSSSYTERNVCAFWDQC